MATVQSYGILGTTGSLVVKQALRTTGVVIWVDFTNGNDAVVGGGQRREAPLKTLAQALTNATTANIDVIVLLAGHAETLTVGLTSTKAGISIVGAGEGSQKAKLICGAAITMLSFSGVGVMVDNIYFPASTTAAPTTRLTTAGQGALVSNCTFDCGVWDTGYSLDLNAAYGRAESCSFVATAATPGVGMRMPGGASNANWAVDCSFDGGAFGWTGNALDVTGVATSSRIIRPRLRNHSDIGIATGFRGSISGEDVGEECRINWTY